MDLGEPELRTLQLEQLLVGHLLPLQRADDLLALLLGPLLPASVAWCVLGSSLAGTASEEDIWGRVPVVARRLLLHVPAADELRRVDLLLFFATFLDLLHLGVCVVLLFFPGQLYRL